MTDSDYPAPGRGSYHQFGRLAVDPELTRFVVRLVLFLFVLAVILVRPPLSDDTHPVIDPLAANSDLLIPNDNDKHELLLVEARECASIIDFLATLDLWEMEVEQPLPPLVFTAFPDDLDELEVSIRKRLFLHTLAPTAMVALAEVAHERAELLRLIGRMEFNGCSLAKLVAAKVAPRDCGLEPLEQEFLVDLSTRYRTENLDVLLNRVDVLPLSLILAQAAMESAWGTSRFVQEGNNIFGIWTWGSEGMVPANRTPGMTHRVAAYDSLLDSVRAYLLMINRVSAYSTLREIRRETRDPLALIKGLRYYSEKRELYVADLGRIIRGNRLQRYDGLTLALNPAEIKEQLARESLRLTRLD